MAIFTFDASHRLGKVRSVDTRRVEIQVSSDEYLRRARVGHLIVIGLPGANDEWLVGIVERVVKTPILEDPVTADSEGSEEIADLALERETVSNTVRVALVGAVEKVSNSEHRFSRSLIQVPEIDGNCYIPTRRATQELYGVAVK